MLEKVQWHGYTEGAGGCWDWAGSINPKGRPILNHQGRTIQAHRATYMVWVGDIPEGLQINHLCDRPVCVNPDHLYAGTHQENMDDKVLRGRWRGHQVLTEDETDFIAEQYPQGLVSQTLLAEMFGVGQTAISKVVNRRA